MFASEFFNHQWLHLVDVYMECGMSTQILDQRPTVELNDISQMRHMAVASIGIQHLTNANA